MRKEIHRIKDDMVEKACEVYCDTYNRRICEEKRQDTCYKLNDFRFKLERIKHR